MIHWRFGLGFVSLESKKVPQATSKRSLLSLCLCTHDLLFDNKAYKWMNRRLSIKKKDLRRPRFPQTWWITTSNINHLKSLLMRYKKESLSKFPEKLLTSHWELRRQKAEGLWIIIIQVSYTQFACSKTRSPQYRVVLVHVFFAKTAPPADFFRVKHFLAEIHVIIK